MGEETDYRDEMGRESLKLDIGGGAVNVEELLRMLEAAVEKEEDNDRETEAFRPQTAKALKLEDFVGMKKTCEDLGTNSNSTQHLKHDETTSSSSAGTPNSMYSACSASGSVFSRCSHGKEKSCMETSQDEEPPCTDDEGKEAGWVERHEVRIRTKLEATSWEEKVEATLDTVHDCQLNDVSKDAVSESRTLRSEDLNNVNTSVSTPEKILGNFQCMIPKTMELDANHLPNKSSAESCTTEVQGLHDDMCTHEQSISSNASVENVVAVACNPCDSPLASRNVMGLNTSTSSSTKNVEAHIQCVSGNSSDPSEKIVDGDASSSLRENDGPVTHFKTTEKKVEGLVRCTEGFSSDLDQADGTGSAIYTKAVQKLDCESPKYSHLTSDKLGGELSDANTGNCGDNASLRGNEQSSRSTIQEREELVICYNSHIKFHEPGSLPEGYKLSTGETGDSSREPYANGWKDGEVLKIKEEVQSKENTGDGPAIQVNLRKLNTRTATAAVLVETEDSVNQLVTSDHEIAGPQQYKSTPKVLGRISEDVLVEATEHGSLERSITASEYFQEYGWDEAKLINVSDLTHTSKEHHCFFRPEVEIGNRNNTSMKVIQEANQASEPSKWPFEYDTGVQRYGFNDVEMGTAEPTVAPDHTITSPTNPGQVYRGDSRWGRHPYSEDQKLANDDEVVEHTVGFGFSCCTPSKRGRGLEVKSRPWCNERTLVRDSSQAFHSINQNDSIFSDSTFLEMEKAASSCVLGINSRQFLDWNKVDSSTSSDSSNESTQSAPSKTLFDRLLRYGGSVKNRRNTRCTPVSRALRGSSVLSKFADEVTERSNSESPTPAHLGGCNHREKVKVVVRMRPFAEHEKMCPLKQILCLPEDKVIVKENNPELLKQRFTRSKEFRDAGFLEYKVDNVVDDSYLQKHRWDKKAESQTRVYELIGLPCLKYALDGYNTTIIAYGQVGSGKTFTMMGDDTDEGRGIMPRLAEKLMNQINTEFKNEFIVQVSYLEIYQERIRDLLVPSKVDSQTAKAEWQGSVDSGASRCGSVISERRWSDSLDNNVYEESMDADTASYLSFSDGTSTSSRRAASVCFDCPSTKKESLKVREHPLLGPYVEGLLWKDVCTWDDMEQVMLEGASRRTLGTTPSNRFSNRGHTMFTIRLFKERGGRSSNVRLINLVDLAGTEKPNLAKRISLDRLDESRYINRSITHLNDVILHLSKNSKFVSYRNSCLTKLLRDSLGGNYKTFLIAHLSPSEQDFQESVNTLRYAAKASHIQTTISAHPEKKKRLIVNTKKEIVHLVQNLARKEEDERREQEVKNQGSCFPILSSFKVPRVEIPDNSTWSLGLDL